MPDRNRSLLATDEPGVPRWLGSAAAVGLRLLVLAVLVWLVAEFLSRATLVVVTVLVALLLAGVLEPLMRRLRRPLPAWLAALVIVLGLVGLLAAGVYALGDRVTEQVSDLRQQLTQAASDLSGVLGVDLTLPEGMVSGGETLSLAASVFEVLVAAFVTVALTFLFLKDGAAMWQWVLARVSDRARPGIDAAARAAWTTTGTYVRRLTVVAAFDAAGVAVGLLVLGVPLVLTLAALQFLGSYIPTIGAFVAGAVAVVVAYVTAGLLTAALTLALVVTVQQIGNSVIEPWLMGHALGLHPAVVLVAVTAGGVLWGIAGALLFVPLTAAATAAAGGWRGARSDRTAGAPS